MSLAGAVTTVRPGLRDIERIITVTPTGNYQGNGAGGDVLNLTTLTNPNFLANAAIGYPGNFDEAEVLASPPGFVGVLVKGGTLATWGIRVYQTGAAVSSPLAELANGAYPAGVLAGVFVIKLKGPKLQS